MAKHTCEIFVYFLWLAAAYVLRITKTSASLSTLSPVRYNLHVANVCSSALTCWRSSVARPARGLQRGPGSKAREMSCSHDFPWCQSGTSVICPVSRTRGHAGSSPSGPRRPSRIPRDRVAYESQLKTECLVVEFRSSFNCSVVERACDCYTNWVRELSFTTVTHLPTLLSSGHLARISWIAGRVIIQPRPGKYSTLAVHEVTTGQARVPRWTLFHCRTLGQCKLEFCRQRLALIHHSHWMKRPVLTYTTFQDRLRLR